MLILCDVLENTFCLWSLHRTLHQQRHHNKIVPQHDADEVCRRKTLTKRSSSVYNLIQDIDTSTSTQERKGTALFIAATLLQREMVETFVPIQAMGILSILYSLDIKSNSVVSRWDSVEDYNQTMMYISAHSRWRNSTYQVGIFRGPNHRASGTQKSRHTQRGIRYSHGKIYSCSYVSCVVSPMPSWSERCQAWYSQKRLVSENSKEISVHKDFSLWWLALLSSVASSHRGGKHTVQKVHGSHEFHLLLLWCRAICRGTSAGSGQNHSYLRARSVSTQVVTFYRYDSVYQRSRQSNDNTKERYCCKTPESQKRRSNTTTSYKTNRKVHNKMVITFKYSYSITDRWTIKTCNRFQTTDETTATSSAAWESVTNITRIYNLIVVNTISLFVVSNNNPSFFASVGNGTSWE